MRLTMRCSDDSGPSSMNASTRNLALIAYLLFLHPLHSVRAQQPAPAQTANGIQSFQSGHSAQITLGRMTDPTKLSLDVILTISGVKYADVEVHVFDTSGKPISIKVSHPELSGYTGLGAGSWGSYTVTLKKGQIAGRVDVSFSGEKISFSKVKIDEGSKNPQTTLPPLKEGLPFAKPE